MYAIDRTRNIKEKHITIGQCNDTPKTGSNLTVEDSIILKKSKKKTNRLLSNKDD